MTPSQKLIDAAAKVYYERVNTFNEEHGLPYTKWDDLSQEYKEDLLYPVVIGPVTVALRAAEQIIRENCIVQSSHGENYLQKRYDGDVLGMEYADTISSLIPAQKNTDGCG